MADEKEIMGERGKGHPGECLCADCDDLMNDWDMMETTPKQEEEERGFGNSFFLFSLPFPPPFFPSFH